MKDHDFLDDLYSNSAKEVPPESLDQAILKQARDHVHNGRFLMRRQWQQFLSLAAVMVLSVYVVLDVGDQSMDVDGLSLSEEASEFIEPAFDEKPVASKAVKKELSLSGNEMRAKAESFKRKEAKRMVSDEVDGIHAGHSLKASPEKMMVEIERLINEGELAKAKILFQKLSETYPEFPVSIRIIEALK